MSNQKIDLNNTMIKVCLADNHPIIHIGIESYFKDHTDISVVANATNFTEVKDILLKTAIDVLILDIELEGFYSLVEIKSLLKKFPKTKIIFYTNLPEQIYASNAIKIGISGFVYKTEKLETLDKSIILTNLGKIVLKNIDLISKKRQSQRLYKKLSNRELDVLRYLMNGKKNKEIAEILSVNMITISTYKLRLLTKLNVTNLIDLVNKVKALKLVYP
jgi:DNA-binding NarL/FixJ family response regulator